MTKSLKLKILVSILLLIMLLVVAGGMSIVEFRKMADSVEKVMDRNYQSIESAKKMLEALERQDSGVLMWLLGSKQSGETTIANSHDTIRVALQEIENNITESNEEEYIHHIQHTYAQYHAYVKEVLSNSNPAYTNALETKFIEAKNAINNLMMLNQNEMYEQAAVLKANSKRAMMPSLVAIGGAIVFVLLLNLFLLIYFIQPLRRVIDEVKHFYPEKGRINANIYSKDELKSLEDEVNHLIIRMEQKHNPNS